MNQILIGKGEQLADVPHRQTDVHFWRDLKLGVRFVIGKSIPVSLAVTVGLWQLCYNGALVEQILFATRVLGLGEPMRRCPKFEPCERR